MYRLFDNPLHLVLLLVVVLIVFGAGKLPGVGAALGQSIKEFKKATNEPEPDTPDAVAGTACDKCRQIVPSGAQFCPSCGAPARPQTSAADADTHVCAQCGAKNIGSARFCSQCGASMNVPAG